MEIDRKRLGKRNKALGRRFEKLTRINLESQGFIVSRWMNNVEFIRCEFCKGSPAKLKQFSPDGLPYYYCSTECETKHFEESIKKGIVWRHLPGELSNDYAILTPSKQGYFRLVSTGFPDFVSIQHVNGDFYQVIGVESKCSGKLDRIEKLKCEYLLNNKIFSNIYIAFPEKVGRKTVVKYKDFQTKEIKEVI